MKCIYCKSISLIMIIFFTEIVNVSNMFVK